MATVPSPRTWSVGDLETAALLNGEIRDNLLFLLGGNVGRKPTVLLHQATAQSFTNATETKINFDTVDEDTDSGWTGTPTNLYTVATPGVWLFQAAISFASNATGTRFCRILNSSTTFTAYSWMEGPIDAFGRASVSLIDRCSVGHQISITGFQASGAALSTAPATSPVLFRGIWLGA